MKTIYINTKCNGIVETIDEFTQLATQTYSEFKKYVSAMIKEYTIAGTDVYKSSRCTNDWKQK